MTLISGFIPFLLALFKKGKKLKMSHPLIIYVGLVFFASFYELVFSTWLNINVTYWFQFYSLLEILGIYYVFSKVNPDYKLLNRVSLIVLGIFYVISFNYWTSENALTSISINKFPITIYVIISFIIWIKTLFDQIRVVNLWHYSYFYFIIGIVFYYFSTAFLFLMSNFLLNQAELFINFWILNIIATFVMRIALMLSVWKMK